MQFETQKQEELARNLKEVNLARNIDISRQDLPELIIRSTSKLCRDVTNEAIGSKPNLFTKASSFIAP